MYQAPLLVTGVVSNDARVLQRVPCYSDTEEEAGVCHEPHEAPGMSGEALTAGELLAAGGGLLATGGGL